MTIGQTKSYSEQAFFSFFLQKKRKKDTTTPISLQSYELSFIFQPFTMLYFAKQRGLHTIVFQVYTTLQGDIRSNIQKYIIPPLLGKFHHKYHSKAFLCKANEVLAEYALHGIL